MALIENESPTIETGFKPVSITLEDIEKWKFDEITFEEQLDKCENGICKFDERDKLIEDLNYSINMEEAILNSGEDIGKLTAHLSLRNLHLKASEIGIELESINLENETDFKTVLEESKEKKVSLITKVINVIKKLINNTIANVNKLFLKLSTIINNNGKKADALLSKLRHTGNKFEKIGNGDINDYLKLFGPLTNNKVNVNNFLKVKKAMTTPATTMFKIPLEKAKNGNNIFNLVEKDIKDKEVLTIRLGVRFLHSSGASSILKYSANVNKKFDSFMEKNNKVGLFIVGFNVSNINYGFLGVKDKRINIEYGVNKDLSYLVKIIQADNMVTKSDIEKGLKSVKNTYYELKESKTSSDKMLTTISSLVKDIDTDDVDLTHNINEVAKYMARMTVDELKTVYFIDRAILIYCNKMIKRFD